MLLRKQGTGLPGSLFVVFAVMLIGVFAVMLIGRGDREPSKPSELTSQPAARSQQTGPKVTATGNDAVEHVKPVSEKGALPEQENNKTTPASGKPSSAGKTYVLQPAASPEDVAALRQVSNGYEGYIVASTIQAIQLDSISMRVVAEIESFPMAWVSASGTGVQNVPLKPEEKAAAVKDFEDALRSQVAGVLRVDDSAPFRLLVVVKQDPEFGWMFIPSIGMGRIEGDVFLVRPSDSSVAFHAKVGRNGRNVNEALLSLAEQVKETLQDNLKPGS
jgi:hypothetical protein